MLKLIFLHNINSNNFSDTKFSDCNSRSEQGDSDDLAFISTVTDPGL